MRRLAFLLVLCLLMTVGCKKKEPSYYLLSVINGTDAPVEVTVSLDKTPRTVKAQSSDTFKIGEQDPAQEGVEREFRIKSGGKEDVVKGRIKYDRYCVLDVTGDSCYALVDYGGAYKTGDLQATATVSDLVVKQIVQKQKYYCFENLTAAVPATLGESRSKLPEKIYQRQGAPPPPVYRMMVVPAELVGNADALISWIAAH